MFEDNALVLRVQTLGNAAILKLDGIGPLLARLTVGWVFVGTGWGKLQHLDRVTAFFTELGLPVPHAQAILVGTTELVGGAFVLVGLLTRLVSLPLLATMVVALLTAKRADIASANDLFGTVEWTYLVLFALLALGGPGRFSLDRLVFGARKPVCSDAPIVVAQTI